MTERCTATFLLPKGWKIGNTREVRCRLPLGHRGPHCPDFGEPLHPMEDKPTTALQEEIAEEPPLSFTAPGALRTQEWVRVLDTLPDVFGEDD